MATADGDGREVLRLSLQTNGAATTSFACLRVAVARLSSNNTRRAFPSQPRFNRHDVPIPNHLNIVVYTSTCSQRSPQTLHLSVTVLISSCRETGKSCESNIPGTVCNTIWTATVPARRHVHLKCQRSVSQVLAPERGTVARTLIYGSREVNRCVTEHCLVSVSVCVQTCVCFRWIRSGPFGSKC